MPIPIAAGFDIQPLPEGNVLAMEPNSNHEPQSDIVLKTVLLLGQQVASLDKKLTEIHQVVLAQRVEKEWFTTGELGGGFGKLTEAPIEYDERPGVENDGD